MFLAGSDLLRRPVEKASLTSISFGEAFPIEPKMAESKSGSSRRTTTPIARFDGIHAFLDNFTLPRPDRSAWGEFAKRGLLRISLGVESGDRDVRSLYDKSWTNEDLRASVADLKSAGLGVSLITLVGAGGVERAESHVRLTSQLVKSLELSAGDFVFLLDENEVRDPNRNPEGLTFFRAGLVGTAGEPQGSPGSLVSSEGSRFCLHHGEAMDMNTRRVEVNQTSRSTNN